MGFLFTWTQKCTPVHYADVWEKHIFYTTMSWKDGFMKTSKNKELAKLTIEERKFIEKYRKMSEEEKKEVLKKIEEKRQLNHSD